MLPAGAARGQAKMRGDLAGGFQRDASLPADKTLNHRCRDAARRSNLGNRFAGGGNGGLKLARQRRVARALAPDS